MQSWESNDIPPPAFCKAATQFNAGQFWESHETLEPLWMEASPETKLFLQGLIQTAAGFVHLQKGNRRGVESVMGRGLDKLHSVLNVPRFHYWMNLDAFVAASDRIYQQVRQLPPGAMMPTLSAFICPEWQVTSG